MGVTPEATEQVSQLLVHHRVPSDGRFELVLFRGVRKFAIEKQVADLQIIAVLSQVLDGIPAVEEHAFIAVDVGNLGFTASRRGKTRVKREVPGFAVERPDVDHLGPDRTAKDGKIDRFSRPGVGERHLAVIANLRCHGVSSPSNAQLERVGSL